MAEAHTHAFTQTKHGYENDNDGRAARRQDDRDE